MESLLIFTAFTALGIWGMPPSVTFGDAGEFAAAAATLGLPHSPGYPLYCLMAKAFGTALSLGNWAYRCNLFSTACGAASLALLARALELAGLKTPARIAAVLFLGLSPLWRYETSVTEIFALNGLFLACLLWLVCRFREDLWSPRSMAAFGLVFGLGMANHHTLVLAAPALFLEGLFSKPAASKMWRGLGVFSGFFLLGMLCYLYLPLRSVTNPPLDWGHPTNWDRFLRVFLRKSYGSLSLTVEGSGGGGWTRLAQVQRYFLFCVREWGLGAAALSLLGAWAWPKLNLSISRNFLLAWILLAGPFFLVLGNPPFDAQTTGALERFYLASWLAGAFLIAAGIQFLESKVSRAVWILLLLPLAGAARGQGAWHARRDFAGYDYGRNVLKSLPPKASLFMDGGDDTFYTLAFLSYAQRLRPDLDLHDRGGLVYRNPYGADFMALPKALKDQRRLQVESSLAGAGVLYYSTLRDSILPSYSLRLAGLLRKPEKEGAAASAPGLWEVYSQRWEPGLLRHHYRDRALVAFYPLMRAEELSVRGDFSSALLEFKRAWNLGPDALWMKPTLSFGLAMLGFRAAQKQSWAAVEEIYGFALRAVPGTPDHELGLGVAYEQTGRAKEAEQAYLRALALDPNSGQAYYDLGSLCWRQARWAESAGYFQKAAALKPADAQWAQLAAQAAERARLKK